MSFHAILNQVAEKIGLDYYDGQSCFTRYGKHQATLTFCRIDQLEAPPIFDICSVVCGSYSEVELSALARTLSYFDGVIG
jgi:hypothetical protein